jgi:predicted TIM-barrel fold metal-dependent hydrolase
MAPAPDSTGVMERGACDCHVHVIGARERYPMAPDRHYTPGPAGIDDLRAHLAGLGLDRVVIVQPSVYGTDNRCMLESLDQLDGAGRGIAVPPDDATPGQLREMHARGVRGVRLNLESSGDRDTSAAAALLSAWAARVADLGWHLQVYAASPVVADLAQRLASLPTKVVLDHFALMEAEPDPAGTGAIPDLLRTGRAFVKLSAPYRIASPALADAWADAFVEAAPASVLWGSDWPHTAREPGRGPLDVSAYRDVPGDELARTMRAWLPAPELRRQVLVDNPAALYGF